MFYVLDVDVFQKENDEFSENIQICKMLNMSTVIFLHQKKSTIHMNVYLNLWQTGRQDLWSQQNNLNITFDRGFGTSGPSISLGIKFQLVFPNSKSFTTWMLILTV